MKKLLLILLPISIFLVSCGGGEDELQPVNPTGTNLTLEQVIVGEKWEGNILGFGEIIFELKNTGELLTYDFDFCNGFTISQNLGNWSVSGDSILYTYYTNGLQIDDVFGVVLSYNSSEIQIYYSANTTSICSVNNLSAVPCTYVPDDGFEGKLISMGADDVFDNYVVTSAIANIDTLIVYIDANGLFGINDFTGIEDFNSLISLQIDAWYHSSSINNTQLSKLNSIFDQLKQLKIKDVSVGSDLEDYIPNLTSVESLYLDLKSSSGNSYSANNILDLSNLVNIKHLTLKYYDLRVGQSELNLTQNTSLESIYIYQCHYLYINNLTMHTNLNYLRLNFYESYNPTGRLDLRNGNNQNILTGNFSISNPNSLEVCVDNVNWSNSNWSSNNYITFSSCP